MLVAGTLGYFTLSICQIVGENLPPEIARKFPRTVGGVRLGRLAIATHHQRKGYGQTLLADALKRCRAIAPRCSKQTRVELHRAGPMRAFAASW